MKARQAAIREASVAIRAALHANARTGRGPKYLFSGLLKCEQCQSNFVIVDTTRYGCSGWRYRGTPVCDNTVMASRKLVETLLLESIQRDLFTEEGLALFKDEAARLLAERRRAQTPDLLQMHAHLQQIEQEITNIMSAIKAGIFTASTKGALEKAEAARARLLQQLHGHHNKLDKVSSFLPNAVERFRALVDDLANVTQHQVDKARGILRELLGKEIRLHPTSDGRARYLTAELSGDYSRLVRLVFGQNKFGGGHGSTPLFTQSLSFPIQLLAKVA